MFKLLRNAFRFVVVYGVGGIVGWLAIEAVKAGITDPIVRDWVIAVMVPLSLVLMTVAFCVWIWKGDQPSVPQRTDDAQRYRRAIHTVMTWLYRRDEGYGTTYDGEIREQIPWKEYARSRYAALELDNEPIEPWQVSAPPEPDQ